MAKKLNKYVEETIVYKKWTNIMTNKNRKNYNHNKKPYSHSYKKTP